MKHCKCKKKNPAVLPLKAPCHTLTIFHIVLIEQVLELKPLSASEVLLISTKSSVLAAIMLVRSLQHTSQVEYLGHPVIQLAQYANEGASTEELDNYEGASF